MVAVAAVARNAVIANITTIDNFAFMCGKHIISGTIKVYCDTI
jgi:hypothetical protein